MIDAGALNRRVRIETPQTTSNAFGEQVKTWSTVANVWAQKQTLTVKDVNRQQGLSAQAEARFLIRYRDGLNSTMRLVYRNEVFHITGIDDYSDSQGLLLYVRKI
ncbi:phage head closure protein [Erythrobacter sp. R86502]|uniref:phage head closure protein n=1 Tax=Erythrobacter sp. R86502 TaxID=3093846 RepID=UPI0036D28D60